MKRIAAPCIAAAAAAVLAGCGIGIGIDIGPDDDPPSVSLSIDRNAAAPGEGIVLTAQASDDYDVWDVDFYRLEAGGRATFVCNDRTPAYHCATTIPSGAQRGSTVNYFARATDSGGQQTDSLVVGVTVQ